MTIRKKKFERRKIYDLFAAKGVYLNNYYLAKTIDEMAETGNGVDYYVEAFDDKFNDPTEGAFTSKVRVYHQITAFDILTNKTVKSFPSIYEAARYLGSISKASNISSVLNKEGRSAFGFIWKTTEK